MKKRKVWKRIISNNKEHFYPIITHYKRILNRIDSYLPVEKIYSTKFLTDDKSRMGRIRTDPVHYVFIFSHKKGI